jgi:4-aminobutyrate aminotransferase-like enzyme/Ser/Thr protein kinase RdoA (MazF antagonist)
MFPVSAPSGTLPTMTDAAAADLGVLGATPPSFDAGQVAAIAARLFGVEGEARDLGSERDQTFMIDADGGGGVVKISNLGEDPAALDLEAAALLHLEATDPDLPVARQLPRRGALDPPRLEDYRPRHRGPGGAHYVRMFERLHGRAMVAGPELDDAAVVAYGAVCARLAHGLRGFFHPAAGRTLLWDTKHAAGLRSLVGSIEAPGRRAIVERVLDRFEARVAPAYPRLRAQVVHGDLALDNVLLDDRGRVSGIVDFGDIVHTSLVTDLAAATASVLRARDPADVLRSGRLMLDGYRSQTPLEPLELELFGDVLAARLATIVTISAWRVERYPENAEYIQAWDADTWTMLEQFDEIGPDAVCRGLGAPAPPVADAELAARRRAALGPAITPPTYARPVHVSRGEGPWLFEAGGRRLLDAYNNVPVVGHCHPRVVEAVVRQTRALNTHARYLYEPLVELAERLIATMPPELGLDTVMLVNSGSEANDVAWRIATASSGGGGAVVTAFAYHGVTAATADVSPEEWLPGRTPAHVETLTAPGGSPQVDGGAAAAAVARLAARGLAPAALYLDTGFTSDGIVEPPAAGVRAAADAVRAAGGLVVADEVQAGHGRNGEHLWSFLSHGLRPDVVTMGKPMGNGYPVAALVVRGEIMRRFAETTEFFSTFGGNPVAAAAALAVLDVVDDYGLIAHADRVGHMLRSELHALAGRRPEIVDVRGRGLLVGVELAGGDAGVVVDRMRERGVLIGRTGPRADVLKIRPPLVFSDEHVPILVAALEDALEGAFAARTA